MCIADSIDSESDCEAYLNETEHDDEKIIDVDLDVSDSLSEEEKGQEIEMLNDKHISASNSNSKEFEVHGEENLSGSNYSERLVDVEYNFFFSFFLSLGNEGISCASPV